MFIISVYDVRCKPTNFSVAPFDSREAAFDYVYEQRRSFSDQSLEFRVADDVRVVMKNGGAIARWEIFPAFDANLPYPYTSPT